MDLKKMHKAANDELKKTAQPLLDKNDNNSILMPIATKLQVSVQTIKNYIFGMGKDGFLTQCITHELKNRKQ